ncbi:NmrA family transcriptional regulator [Mycobacterium paraense]|uniref:NmrA family transcriptional regulator n=1 Tax=Mycobacterium paraense TaxID=767916 RepID=A0A1X2AK90_9MYCO|nr:NAD(P)H-binding protein [Mycobacterium paraense]ORW32115.1 NmrA family transcriptional regulator [Mycobacterium paraense]ORW41164.1 NmrA family transcriptional regulator [Mycobacterium paraense]ORW51791.1 NmrA family transcriptional regulator [Mycobacterium paraense]
MSSDRLFLITGATGNTGAPTVRLLREAGHRVRAFVHRADRRSEALAALGAEIVEGDLLDFRAVSSAMSGVSAAYFCYPIAPGGLLPATAIFAQAASEAGVEAVVNMSQISARREAKSHAAQQHWLAERLLDRSAFGTTHLRPTFFAEWLIWQWLRNGNEGVLPLPFGNGRHAPIAGYDQARVIAAILQNPAPHDRQVYPLVGAEELDHYGIADQMADTLGIPVRYEPVDIPAFAAALSAHGMPDFFVQHISSVAQDYRDGIFAGENNLVEVVGGHKPMTVADFVTANRAAFERDGHFALRELLAAA